MRLRIRFDSDWRIGSGAGLPGSLDDLVLKDSEGFPYLPAKTLKGMLRDGCETVAALLGREWPRVVDALLGTDTHAKTDPGAPNFPSRLGVRRAELPESVREALRGPSQAPLRDALTFAMPHVRIDPATGAAKRDFLFHLEVARAGAELVAALDTREPLTPAQCALLHAGAAAVRRMGGKRRRGLGRCTVSVEDIEGPPQGGGDWLTWLEAHHASVDLTDSTEPVSMEHQPGEPSWGAVVTGPEDRSATGSGVDEGRAPAAGEWWVFPLCLEARTPLCLPRRTVGNLVEGLDHIPGTLLLPLVHAALDAAGEDAATLIRSGRALVTHAYPLQSDGSPSWPAPHALHAEKAGQGLESPTDPVVNELIAANDEEVDEPQRKALRHGYVTAATPPGVRPRFRRPALQAAMHNTVADLRQRPTEDVGGVFTFQVIPAGTRLAGEVRVDARALAPGLTDRALQALLAQAARGYAVGRAKADEYGQVEVELGKVDRYRAGERSADDEESSSDALEGDALTVWLLSDALVRDDYLGWSAGADHLRVVLEDTIGVKLTLEREHGAFARGHRAEGWVRSWALPRPSLTGLAAGSCYRFRVEGAPPDLAQRLGRIHVAGLGERRAEGFGQVRFQAPLLATRNVPKGEQRDGAKESADDGHPGAEAVQRHASAFLERVEEEAWKDAIRGRALDIGGDLQPLGINPSRSGAPPNSQLGALRSAGLRLRNLEGEDRVSVLSWLVHLRATKNRSDKWPKESLEAIWRLLEGEAAPHSEGEWGELDKRLRHEDAEQKNAARQEMRLPESFDPTDAEVWRMLFAHHGREADWPPTATPTGRERLAVKLWPFAVTTLIQGVCASVLDRREAENRRHQRDETKKEAVDGTPAR